MTAVSTMSAYSSFIPQGQQAMAMNTVNLFNMSSLLNQKDSRWLQLEVCREYQRQKCSRCDAECKFAHPPPNVEVQNGRVTACYDSIKGRCNREKPACKYFHPPQHLKDQLLINGRNHLALKNALAQQMQQQLIPGHAQMIQQAVLGGHYAVPSVPPTYLPYLSQLPLIVSNQDQGQTVQMGGGHCHPAVQHQPSVSSGGGQQQVQPGQVPLKQRSDRIEACREFLRGACLRSQADCRYAHPPEGVPVCESDGTVRLCMDATRGRCQRSPCRYYHASNNVSSATLAELDSSSPVGSLTL